MPGVVESTGALKLYWDFTSYQRIIVSQTSTASNKELQDPYFRYDSDGTSQFHCRAPETNARSKGCNFIASLAVLQIRKLLTSSSNRRSFAVRSISLPSCAGLAICATYPGISRCAAKKSPHDISSGVSRVGVVEVGIAMISFSAHKLSPVCPTLQVRLGEFLLAAARRLLDQPSWRHYVF